MRHNYRTTANRGYRCKFSPNTLPLSSTNRIPSKDAHFAGFNSGSYTHHASKSAIFRQIKIYFSRKPLPRNFSFIPRLRPSSPRNLKTTLHPRVHPPQRKCWLWQRAIRSCETRQFTSTHCHRAPRHAPMRRR